MKNYIGTKFIKAEKMNYGDYCIKKYGNTNNFDNDTGLANDTKGYIVEYEDGYTSWSPKEVFEKAYHEYQGELINIEYEMLSHDNIRYMVQITYKEF